MSLCGGDGGLQRVAIDAEKKIVEYYTVNTVYTVRSYGRYATLVCSGVYTVLYTEPGSV